jgi:TolB-like protein/DNA-binding winged helix-turn-helix (wHTH) protein/Tfp pilus assembly protein PilF
MPFRVSLLVNSSSQSPQGFRFGIFEIDLEDRELRKNGLTVGLQDQPFKILVAMVRRAGEVISREDLYGELSSHSTYDFKHGLNNAIQKIREVLGDSPENARFIETVPNRGYRFLPQVEPIYKSVSVDIVPPSPAEDTFAPAVVEIRRQLLTAVSVRDLTELGHRINALIEQHRENPNQYDAEVLRDQIARAIASDTKTDFGAVVGTVQPDTRKRRSIWLKAMALLVIVAIPLSLYFAWSTRPRGKVMLVVVPFLNMSGDPGQEYVAEGMTEEMITQLSRLNPKRLAVIARTTSMQYKGTHKDAAQIGRETKANYLLEGSVQREGKRVRVTAQLIQTSDQTHLWAESFDGDLGDMLKMQSAIARAIASETQIVLSKQVQEQLASAPSVNPEAHLAYLQGLQAITLRSKPGIAAAIIDFKQSIAIDPNYAPAYAGLARAYNLAPVYDDESEPRLSFAQAAAAATRALALDDTLSDAHSALAFTKAHWEFDWPGAEREFRKAIDLEPSSAWDHFTYANSYLTPMGRHDEAIAEIKKAIDLDPLFVPYQSFLGRTYQLARRYDDALAQLKRSGDLNPNIAINHVRLAHLYAHLRRYPDAIAEETRARLLTGESLQQASTHEQALKRAFESDGPSGYWQKELEFADEKQNPPEAYVTPVGRAIIYAEFWVTRKRPLAGWSKPMRSAISICLQLP